jgi:uncharacterized iron-regulated membrane protein
MSTRSIRGWWLVHKWTSLICTLFLLLLCITGLPLIFYHEIEELLDPHPEPAPLAEGTPRANPDWIVETAAALQPGEVVQYLSFDPDEPDAAFVTLGASADAVEASAFYMFDARTGELLHEYPLGEGIMYVLWRLHVDMFADLPGTLFLGLMGLLLVASLVSGAVLYGPFMRRLQFGTVRHERAPRTRWLDLHNLLGIATLIWLVVVGTTGAINTLALPIYGNWQATELAEMSAPYRSRPPLAELGSVARALASARAAAPDMAVSFVAFPGTEWASPHHFGIYLQGGTPLTSRLFKPMLVDARTGEVTDQRDLPWYVTALLISQPLHFGDYGGLPLKVLWAILDLLAIVVLGSGLYLWLKKRQRPLEALLATLADRGSKDAALRRSA